MIRPGDDRTTVQAIPVTDATEREASTRAALKSHKVSCAPSADVLPCQTCTRLTFAWRQALREAAAATGQITTEGATR